jgi:hypothetical protein
MTFEKGNKFGVHEGPPLGNQNARKGSLIKGAIRRALAEDSAKGRETLQNIIRKMLDDAEAGDAKARTETFDRLDGKAMQPSEISGPDGGEIPAKIVVELVKP